MKIEQRHIKVRDEFEGYCDNGDDGVFAFGGRLAVRSTLSIMPDARVKKSLR